MYKLRVKFSTFFKVSSVLLIDDQNIEFSNVLFSLKHRSVDSFIDEFGDFSPGEKKIGLSETQGDGEIALKPDVFANVEEFDKLQIVIYDGEQKLHSSTFSWPHNSGNTELEIDLYEDTGEGPVDPPPPPPPPSPSPSPSPPSPSPPSPSPPSPPPPTSIAAWVKWVLAGVCVAALALAVLGYIIYERGFFDKNSALLNQENCNKTSFLASALKSDAKRSEFRDLCAEHYSQMSETKFNDMVKSISKEDDLLLELGHLYDGSRDESFLKEIWPNVKAELPLTVFYYHLAEAANVSGASKLLKDACSKIETSGDLIMSFDKLSTIGQCESTSQ